MLGVEMTVRVVTAALLLHAFVLVIPSAAQEQDQDEVFLSGISGLRAEVQVIGPDVLDRKSVEAEVLELLLTSGIPLVQSRDEWLKVPGQPLLTTELIFGAGEGSCAFHVRTQLTELAQSLHGTQASDTRPARARTGLWALWGWTTDHRRCANAARQGVIKKVREFIERFFRANPGARRADGATAVSGEDLALAEHVSADPRYVSVLLDKGVLLRIHGLGDHESDNGTARQSIIGALKAAGVAVLDDRNAPEGTPTLTLSAGTTTFGEPRSHCVIAPVTELREMAVLTRTGRDAQITAWASAPFVTSLIDDVSLQENCRKKAFEKLQAQLQELIASQRTDHQELDVRGDVEVVKKFGLSRPHEP